ncbi:uncharacterized protein PRCAT00001450001 [Priceomyces carsonii]|uniref:uncharacterized protein n=1 Tax=Priceomyces carsonii TaxID=28549 RepID=UPI002ED7AF33|nr:unnamed protein product [Priceomyces carsonii]
MREITRVRTGCLNCRKKHKKCDEGKPSCGLCVKNNEICEWPINYGRFNKNSIKSITGIRRGRLRRDSKESNSEHGKDDLNNKDSLSIEIPKNNFPICFKNTKSKNIIGDRMSHRESNTDKGMQLAKKGLTSEVLKGSRDPPFSEADVNNDDVQCCGNATSDYSPLDSTAFYENEGSNNLNEGSKSKNLPVSYTTIANLLPRVNEKTPSKISLNLLLNVNDAKDGVANFDTSRSVETLRGPPLAIETNTIPALSPDSIMTPFLHYKNLNNTLRDYMFTNVVSAPDMNNDFTITAEFNNILHSFDPNPIAGRSLTNYLNESDFVNKDSMWNIVLKTENKSKMSEILDSFKHEKPSLSSSEKLNLLKNYLYEIAPWLDMFDISKQFGRKIPELAQTNNALLYALYAISSRQKEQVTSNYEPELTIRLYQESLRQLIPTVDKTMDKAMISSCVILCVFEMMSSAPDEWRHHLEGCCAQFKAHNIHGFSDGFERALFWCYARMDVNSAVIAEQSTICESEYWIGRDISIGELKEQFLRMNSEDMYSNYIVFLCGRVLNLIAKETKSFEEEWQILWNEVIDWYINRPVQLRPILEYEEKPFPGILFLNGPAISANQLYHMSIILLIQNKPRGYKIIPSYGVKSTIWHAKQICAISIHNHNHGCWNNAVQPLWIAGKLLSSDEEHETILNLLNEIETTTGWQMTLRAKDLKSYWDGTIAY